jgi:hypothetical protein
VVVFIKRVFKEGKHVADETKKEIEKFAKTPFQSVVDAPDNIIREGGKALENLDKAIKDVGIPIPPTPTPSNPIPRGPATGIPGSPI